MKEDSGLSLVRGGLHPKTGEHHFINALAYVKAHPEYLPYVVEAVRGGGAEAPRAARILGVLGRPTDIAVLRESVEDSEFAGIASAEALLVMPYPEAHKALWEVISNGKEPGAVSAIEAVRHKKNIESCPAIQNALQAPNKEVRFHALDVAFKLHCIDAKRVADFVNDPDREIAEKAKGFLQP